MKQIIVAQVQTKITINQAVQVRVPEAVQTALIEGVLIQNQVVAINQIIVVVLIIILIEVVEVRHEAVIIQAEAVEVRHAVVRIVLLVLDEDKYSKAS